MSKLSTPVIKLALSQVQGVEHVLAHAAAEGSNAHSVIVWTYSQCVEAHLSNQEQLSELVDIVEEIATGALPTKKRTLKVKITD